MDQLESERRPSELWSLMYERRKEMEQHIVELAILEMAEFEKAARHMVEVGRGLQVIARQGNHVRLEDDLKRLIGACEHAGEATDEAKRVIEALGLTAGSSR